MARKIEKLSGNKVKITEDVSQTIDITLLESDKAELERRKDAIERNAIIKINQINKELVRINEILAEVKKLK